MDKATAKVRIVFDCAAKCNGISLNDMIHAGPKLLQGLFNVLVRFRRNLVGIACDIKEMYLQIEVKEQDRFHFRLLWRDLDPNREPDVFEFNRVVFAKNSAPMESQFIAQENARRNQDRYPLAAETVLKSTYMDDLIDSVENDEEGVELYRQLKAPWGAANMQTRKWISNSPEVMQDPNRPREMPEKKTSRRKEDTNGCTTLLTNNLQKEAASKQDDKLGVWRLDPKRFSSWIRLLRVHARMRRVLLKMRRRDNRNARMELLPEEIKDAEEEIVRLAQRQAFCEEYIALRSGKPISKKSQLIKLNSCIDEDGIIRCDDQLKFADFLPYDTRFPIILPRGHWVTKLIVKNYHGRGNHAAGVNFTLCQLSERFWIIAHT